MYTVFFRMLIIYVLITAMLRLMGKRQVGELEMSDLVATLLLSELAAQPIEKPDIPLFHAVIPVLLIVSVEIIITFLKTKVNFLKRIFEGKPSLLIDRGRINQKELARTRLSIDELLSELRIQGYGNPEDVYYAILEESGKISVLPRADKQPLTPSDTKTEVSEKGLSLPLISDGSIQPKNLERMKKDEAWLCRECKKKSCTPEEVFLLTLDDAGGVNLVKKESR